MSYTYGSPKRPEKLIVTRTPIHFIFFVIHLSFCEKKRCFSSSLIIVRERYMMIGEIYDDKNS